MGKGSKHMREQKAGLLLSVSRVQKTLRRGLPEKRCNNDEVPVYLTGVLENLTETLLHHAAANAAAAKSLETALMTNTTLEKLDLRDNDKLWTYVMGIDGDGAADGLMALARGLNGGCRSRPERWAARSRRRTRTRTSPACACTT